MVEMLPEIPEVRGPCAGCGRPSVTAYCDLCAPPLRRTGRALGPPSAALPAVPRSLPVEQPVAGTTPPASAHDRPSGNITSATARPWRPRERPGHADVPTVGPLSVGPLPGRIGGGTGPHPGRRRVDLAGSPPRGTLPREKSGRMHTADDGGRRWGAHSQIAVTYRYHDIYIILGFQWCRDADVPRSRASGPAQVDNLVLRQSFNRPATRPDSRPERGRSLSG
jgi:hypothetical protein